MSYWWGKDGVTLEEITVDGLADLAVGRLAPFTSRDITAYPTFKNSADPMLPVAATFDEATGQFQLAPGTLPLPFFPLDGIHTRLYNLTARKRASGALHRSIDPGLRGQSGGPVFEHQGVIWGIQSRTVHLPLGFNPMVPEAGSDVEEHQFLNVGLASHIDEIVRLFQATGVAFELSGR